ncbi:cell-cycle control medial ring component [Xylariomycetidae sp. FL2044]|nr:cell-cycle control medial ring component [Xylariomycetidae sp. FL2044]
MTEVSFAKNFLATLDSRPIQVPEDFVEDPRTYTTRNPYVLPKMRKPMSKRKSPTSTAPPGSERSYTVTIKSLRNPPLDVRLSSQTPNTSVLDLKAAVAERAGVPVDKMKLLYKKKPVLDSKVLKDLVGEGEEGNGVVEFSVMVLGGAAAVGKKADADTEGAGEKKSATDGTTKGAGSAAQGQSGAEVLETKEFWQDLRGFLLQRIRDEKMAGELSETFQSAWRAKK